MNKVFKADHFTNINELLEHCNLWIENDDYDAYCRHFDMGAMKELFNYINNLEQALNEIKGIIEDCKKLMLHEFDWEEQADNILKKIDKVLGGSDE